MNEQSKALRVADIMDRNPFRLSEEDNLEGIGDCMMRKGWRFVPVVSGKRLVGVVPLGRALPSLNDTHILQAARARRAAHTFAARRMEAPMRVVRANERVADVAQERGSAFGEVFVVDGAGNLVGRLTEKSWQRALRPHAPRLSLVA